MARSLACLALACSFLVPPISGQTPQPDDFNPSPDGAVRCLAVQPDGMILVGGSFTNVGWSRRKGIARLRADGTLDAAFSAEAAGGFWVGTHYEIVNAVALQVDGKIVVGGGFSTLGGERRDRIGRLNPDGTVDQEFNPGADDWVRCLALQPDGKILVGGNFITLAGQRRSRIGRLNADCTLDSEFADSGTGRFGVSALAVLPDGKILAGGTFTNMAGLARSYLGRLLPDGTPDAAFELGADNWVNALTMQADGRILVGGDFTRLGGQARSRIGRLDLSGALEGAFDPGAGYEWANPLVFCFAVQADGRILVGGVFTRLGGEPRRLMGRLNSDGTVDPAFNPQAGGGAYPYFSTVYSLALQPDGEVLVGGAFSYLGESVGGFQRTNLGRLHATEPATQTLTYDGSAITWLRGGTSPEVLHTTFEASANGVDWKPLGVGVRITGGWFLEDVTVAAGNTIRARGHGGGSIVETRLTAGQPAPPIIVRAPPDQAIARGGSVVLEVIATGAKPMRFQWFSGPGGDTSNPLPGATDASFTTPALWATTSYWVRVTNAAGIADSQAITISVASPEFPALAVTQFSAGMLRLEVTGPTRSRWRLQQSPDCVNWQPWDDGGVIELVDGRVTVELTTLGALTAFFRLASER